MVASGRCVLWRQTAPRGTPRAKAWSSGPSGSLGNSSRVLRPSRHTRIRIAVTGHDPPDASLENRVGGERWRHEDQRGVGAGFGDGVHDGVEDGHTVDILPRFAGCDAGDDLGAVFAALLGVKAPFLAGDALDDDLGFGVDPDTHAAPPTAPTTFSAASAIPSPTMTSSKSRGNFSGKPKAREHCRIPIS